MSQDKAKEIRDRLEEWLQEAERVQRLVPQVQRAYDGADWQYKAWTDVSSSAPEHIRVQVEQTFARTYEELKTYLPELPSYSTASLGTIANTVTGSTMSLYGAILTAENIQDFGEIARPHVVAYQALQENQNRVEQVRGQLNRKFPVLIPVFTIAADSVERSRTDKDGIPGAANDLRLLLDKLKGELFDRARRAPRENMTWDKMAVRLGSIPDESSGQKTIKEQEKHGTQIYELLSDIVHKRNNRDLADLQSTWPLVLDHLLITLEAF
jgi:hypothetical protein